MTGVQTCALPILEQRRQDAARTDRVHPDPVFGELECGGARQVDDGRLRGGVGRRAGAAREARHRRGVQDGAASLLREARSEDVAAVDHPVEVDLDDPTPVRERDVAESGRTRAPAAGVEMPEGLKRPTLKGGSGPITQMEWARRGEITPEMELDRKSTRLNSSHMSESRMPSSA